MSAGPAFVADFPASALEDGTFAFEFVCGTVNVAALFTFSTLLAEMDTYAIGTCCPTQQLFHNIVAVVEGAKYLSATHLQTPRLRLRPL